MGCVRNNSRNVHPLQDRTATWLHARSQSRVKHVKVLAGRIVFRLSDSCFSNIEELDHELGESLHSGEQTGHAVRTIGQMGADLELPLSTDCAFPRFRILKPAMHSRHCRSITNPEPADEVACEFRALV